MKRILLVLGLVLLTTLLFADVGSDPLGEADGQLNMSRLALQMRAKLLTQARLMSQARLGPQANEPAEPEAREAPARLQERSGDCTSGCEGEPVQAKDRVRDQAQLQDGTGDGNPDRDRDRTGQPQ